MQENLGPLSDAQPSTHILAGGAEGGGARTGTAGNLPAGPPLRCPESPDGQGGAGVFHSQDRAQSLSSAPITGPEGSISPLTTPTSARVVLDQILIRDHLATSNPNHEGTLRLPHRHRGRVTGPAPTAQPSRLAPARRGSLTPGLASGQLCAPLCPRRPCCVAAAGRWGVLTPTEWRALARAAALARQATAATAAPLAGCQHSVRDGLRGSGAMLAVACGPEDTPELLLPVAK